MTIENKHNQDPVIGHFTKTKLSRRALLKGAGASVIILAFSGGMWRAIDQGVFSTGKGPAYELWNIHEEPAPLSGPLALVQAAVLASNPHNSQPWLFKVSDGSIDLYADESRHIGSMDPFNREMDIGLGCALENLMLAAEAHGFNPAITFYPSQSDTTHVAHIQLEPGDKVDSPLYEMIPHRYTHRGSYQTNQEISTKILEALSNLNDTENDVQLTWLTSAAQMEQAGDLTILATEKIIADQEMSNDSNKWYRDNWNDLQNKRDGITLDAQGQSALIRVLGKLLPPLSQERNDQFWLKATKDTHVPTAGAYGLISVRDPEDKVTRLKVGRLWQRIHLQGTLLGIGMHPLNQLMEMKDREIQVGAVPYFGDQLKSLSPNGDWSGIFLFRLGYPVKHTWPSPRRSLEDVLI